MADSSDSYKDWAKEFVKSRASRPLQHGIGTDAERRRGKEIVDFLLQDRTTDLIIEDTEIFKVSKILESDIESIKLYLIVRTFDTGDVMHLVVQLVRVFFSVNIYEQSGLFPSEFDRTRTGSFSAIGTRESASLKDIPLVYPLLHLADTSHFNDINTKIIEATKKLILKRLDECDNIEEEVERVGKMLMFSIRQISKLFTWKESQLKFMFEYEERARSKVTKRESLIEGEEADTSQKSETSAYFKASKDKYEKMRVTHSLVGLHTIVLDTLNYIFDHDILGALNGISNMEYDLISTTNSFLAPVDGSHGGSTPDAYIRGTNANDDFNILIYEVKESLKSQRIKPSNTNAQSEEATETFPLKALFERNEGKPYFYKVTQPPNTSTSTSTTSSGKRPSELKSRMFYTLGLWRQLTASLGKYSVPFGAITDATIAAIFKINLERLKRMDLEDPFIDFDVLIQRIREDSVYVQFISNSEGERYTEKSGSLPPKFNSSSEKKKMFHDVATRVTFINMAEPPSEESTELSESSAFPLKVALVQWCFEDEFKDHILYSLEEPEFTLETEANLRDFFNNKVVFIPLDYFVISVIPEDRGHSIPIQASILGILSMILSDADGLKYIMNSDNVRDEYGSVIRSLFESTVNKVKSGSSKKSDKISKKRLRGDNKVPKTDRKLRPRPNAPPDNGILFYGSRDFHSAICKDNKSLLVYEGSELFGDSPQPRRLLHLDSLGKCLQGLDHWTQLFYGSREKFLNVFKGLTKYTDRFPDDLVYKSYLRNNIEGWFRDNYRGNYECSDSEDSDYDEDYGSVRLKEDTLRVFDYCLVEVEAYNKIQVYNDSQSDERERIKAPRLYVGGDVKLDLYWTPARCLIMDYIKPDDLQLREIIDSEDKVLKKHALNECLKIVKKLNMIGIRHNDLATRNFIMSGGVPYVIDFSHTYFHKMKVPGGYEASTIQQMESVLRKGDKPKRSWDILNE